MTTEEEAVAPLKANLSTTHTAYHGIGIAPFYTSFLPLPYDCSSQPYMGLYGNVAFQCMYPYGYMHPTLTTGAVQYNSYPILAPSPELLMAAPMAEADEKSSLESSAGQSKKSMDINTANGCDNTAKGTSLTEFGTRALCDRSKENGIPRIKTANLEDSSAATSRTLSGGLDHPIASQLQGSTDSELSFSNSHRGGQDGTSGEVWSQDNKETKRQRRKQSNRESARRSRLRKQAECEELSMHVDGLIAENTSLRTELDRLSEECRKVFAENAAIMKSLCGDNGEVNLLLSEQV